LTENATQHDPALSEELSRRQEGVDHSQVLLKNISVPPGYDPHRPKLHYAAIKTPLAGRRLGVFVDRAHAFLDEQLDNKDTPWCCVVSTQEPHDPFVCGEETFEKYDFSALTIPENCNDDLADKPGMYRKAAHVYADMSDRQKREAAACYYASITEIDELYGTLIDRLEEASQLDNTIIILTSDHGEMLGAHGLYCKNVGAFEEAYRIPMTIAGPGIAEGVTSSARVGLHDLCPTICELSNSEPIDKADSKSFASLLSNPIENENKWQTGFAEYWGGRYLCTQLVYWEDNWKLVHNGFDIDELYELDNDPNEMNNLSESSDHQERLRSMFHGLWRKIHPVGLGGVIKNGQYPVLRLAPYGPWDEPIH